MLAWLQTLWPNPKFEALQASPGVQLAHLRPSLREDGDPSRVRTGAFPTQFVTHQWIAKSQFEDLPNHLFQLDGLWSGFKSFLS